MKIKSIISSLILTFIFLSCQSNSIFNKKSDYINKNISAFKTQFSSLKSTELKQEWIDDIISFLREESSLYLFPKHFSQYLTSHNDTSFDAYLNYAIAEVLWNNNKESEALYYMLEVNESYYKMQYNYQDIGYLIGLKIIKLKKHYNLKEKTYNFLLDNYKNDIDEPVILFELAQNYKKQFKIKEAIKVTRSLLKVAQKSEIADNRINLNNLQKEVIFYYSSKNWIDQDVEKLVNKIKVAIRRRDKKLIKHYASKTNFRVRYFKDDISKSKSYNELAIFRWWNGVIYFNNSVESFSTENEIYLRSYGWKLPQMREWYFYFRKVNYPYDSKIDGGWEWAGIYFGNWL